MRALLPFLYLLWVGTEEAGALDRSLPFMEYLDPSKLVCLEWGFDSQQGDITFRLAVNTSGWVGFGFSPNGGMAGSDIVMGGLGPQGSYFKDYHATGNAMPSVDEKQSYTLLSMNESDGQTIMTFRRSIQSCDEQDFHITGQSIKLIYAYGPTDEISYHQGRRGTKEVNLLNYMPRTTITSSNYLNATVDNFSVPAVHTYYHCKVMQFPPLTLKHHVYLIEPVIEHPDIIHHMLLYRCPSFVTVSYERPCYRGDMGDYCFGVVAAWGVGGGVFALPEDAGIPIGGEHSNTFYRLEIHYDNPNKEAGRTDSSGLRLHYTSQLRQFDVGILFTGLSFDSMKYNIPANTTEFRTYGVCNTSLFSQHNASLPDLQVFGVLMHTHLAGRKIRVAHYRNGEQIDFLALDENYNFDLQQMTNLGNIKTIKQGDEILVECTYSTTNRTGLTKIGLATTDEMCLAFLFYYPAIQITSCISYPDTSHPLMNNYQISDNTTSDEEITAYESVLKTVPQIQLTTDDVKLAKYNHGTVREMKKTPTTVCTNANAASRLGTSWIVNPAGIVLSLLWIAVI